MADSCVCDRINEPTPQSVSSNFRIHDLELAKGRLMSTKSPCFCDNCKKTAIYLFTSCLCESVCLFLLLHIEVLILSGIVALYK